ncbi:DNA mismatch repair protein MutS [Candidatus Acetothermia bacterium]|nr:DNA mismatch repair protein MutS [Candidatus Acetothermia bacterium]
MSTPTSMMDQYLRIKAAHPDAILFFHLGDFYETFYDDAKLTAQRLDIVLTARNGIPMAGVPVKKVDIYLNRLLRHGHKVVLCQQVEDAQKATGLVKREVVRVITPGTILDDEALEVGVNNYLCAIYASEDGNGIGTAVLDLSTGEYSCQDLPNIEELWSELVRLTPAEILLSNKQDQLRTTLQANLTGPLISLSSVAITEVRSEEFDPEAVSRWFELATSAEIKAPADSNGLKAAGAILAYISRTQRSRLPHIRPLLYRRPQERIKLDPFTQHSLELVQTMRGESGRGTLIAVLDQTTTQMGRRLLRRFLLAPLTDQTAIKRRLDAVEALLRKELLQQELIQQLKRVSDLERLAGKLGTKRLSPRDLLAIANSLKELPALHSSVQEAIADSSSHALEEIAIHLHAPQLERLRSNVDGIIVDDPPVDPREGNLIRDGVNQRLDSLREEARAYRSQIAMLEQRERARSGISSLKVGYNRVFGYYIEVTTANLDKVPPDYTRRQTLANAERFITEELKDYEQKIALTAERINALEHEIFAATVEKLTAQLEVLQKVADALAALDVYLSLAIVAGRYGYTRPQFTAQHRIKILDGRHPVVEQVTEFVPNDLIMDERIHLVILTGPNMAGKSVYLRQAALISLMAQMGSFVPAKEALLPVLTRIFTRIGATDMVAEGRSTFMMEMLETVSILRNADRNSLIILDELGRGTSTFDGVSIAWAVARKLATTIKAKTLFATHYHELTKLADEIPGVSNSHIVVQEVGSEIVFLHRVEEGTATGSYGIHVARLAGLPKDVIATADEILAKLTSNNLFSALGDAQSKKLRADCVQLPLFGTEDHPVLKSLQKIDPNQLTPLQALELLAKLKQQL